MQRGSRGGGYRRAPGTVVATATSAGAAGSLRVLVADAEPDDAARIHRALESRGLEVVAEEADAVAAVAAAERERPDLCLIDLDLPGGGLTAVAQIAARVAGTTIVGLARVESHSQMIGALERGASGYLLKGMGADELARTLRAAHAGEPAVSRSLVSHLVEHVRRGSGRYLALPGGAVALTPREWEVAELVRVGAPTDEIARRLGLSPVTVRRHVSALLRKSGATSRAGLAEALKRYAR